MVKRLVEGFAIYQKPNGRYEVIQTLATGKTREIKHPQDGDYEFYANAACALAGRLFR